MIKIIEGNHRIGEIFKKMNYGSNWSKYERHGPVHFKCRKQNGK